MHLKRGAALDGHKMKHMVLGWEECSQLSKGHAVASGLGSPISP